MTVTALLVSHGGAGWLPAVLEGIAAQTHPLDGVVAVDTGSKDDSVALLTQALGAAAITTAPRNTSYAEAVDLGLAAAGEPDWVWLLHDDSRPEPGALAALLAAADAAPEADILGPKLREWPSLRRLLELGITISGTGRRETGLERGEYDQGQHDDVRRVLAVNTAGMLVRREVLTQLGGFDRNLPVFGNDLDFGWRAAQAGRTTLVVPQAVVFHVEAAHRGVRRTPLTGRHTHYQERRAALYTLLANTSGRSLPLLVVRLALGTVLRALGFLLVRSVGEALDELAALVSLYSRPGQLRQARRDREPMRTADPAEVRPLLAPWWLPYRHGLDFVSDLAAAATHQAQDVAERRRDAKLAAEGTVVRARVEDEDEVPVDTSLAARFLTNPLAVLVAVFVALALVGARSALGHVSGGALSPAPASTGDWWRLYTQHWHPLANGTDVPAPAYVAPLALLATVTRGPSVAVSALMVLAVPLALWGAWRLLRVVGRLVHPVGISRWLLAFGAASYSLVPATSGAWGDGRLGTVVTTTLLPWVAHAALGFADPEPDRRWRAAWRTGLLLALATSFTPALWLLAVLLGAVVLGAAFAISPGDVRQRSALGPPLTALAVGAGLLLPWWGPLVAQGRAGGVLLEAGRLPAASLDGWDLLLGRASDTGAPVVVGAAVLGLALLALLPGGSRIPVLVCWIVALVTAVTAAVVSHVSPGAAEGTAWPGLGVFVVLVQGALLTAVVLAAQEAARRLTGRPARVVRAVGLVALAIVPALGLGWFAAGGHDRLSTDPPSDVPAYMVQSSLLGPAHGVLVLEGSVADGVTYTVRRGDGVTLGEDEILALTPEDTEFSAVVRTLVSRPTAAEVARLGKAGIEYVVLKAPADGSVTATLDATAGLAQASAEDRSTRAWQVERDLDAGALAGPGSTVRTVLLLLQALGVLVVAVLCGPTRRARR